MASTVKTQVSDSSRAEGKALISSIVPGIASAVLLDFCFPVAGPLPHWRALLAWVAMIPLLWALLREPAIRHPRYLRRAALTGYLCGVVWYILNCYWIYQTMLYYGNVPPFGSAGIVVLFSAVLGLYFGAFGLGLAMIRWRFGIGWALTFAPFLWAALELAAARITSVPWDQLGYSQVDSLNLTRLAPWTGVYGISFVLVAGNALLFADWLPAKRVHVSLRFAIRLLVLGLIWLSLGFREPAASPTSDYAVLLQPNIDVAENDNWQGPQWEGNVVWLTNAAGQTCTPAFDGMPQPKAAPPDRTCRQNSPPPGVVVWPEVGSWFQSDDPRTLTLVRTVATSAHAPFIAGMFGRDATGTYNSALFVNSDGTVAGRYDKLHLVPFGEFVPYRDLFFFAKKLTHQLVDLQRGHERRVFRADGHTFGVFICYESVFADEVRLFAKNGAEVLVNISDDGWYGDTSAPWQHLNMARMRAIENDRWILRDTNNGVTTAIDPEGRVTVSAERHSLTSLVARYGYKSDLTFYTRYGDVFAYLCCVVVIVGLGIAVLDPRRKSDGRSSSANSSV